jgi:putrescine aminotransferase
VRKEQIMTAVSPRAVLDVYRRNVNRGMGKLLGLLGADLETSASGCYVFDQEGRRYLNAGGFGVFLLGHCHPVVIAAVQEQLHCMPLATRLLVDPRLPRAAQALVAVAPPGLEYVLFTNSGTEAVEAALKIARVSGYRHTIASTGGYHGKTLGALSVSGRPRYRDPFMPLLGEVTFVAFADIGEMRSALAASTAPTCVILEPVQAEGGVHVPPQGYLRAVKDLCSEFGAILIVDEIQTGLGRLGSWWGCTPEGVQPDILLVGKILSGGVVPVAAVVTRSELFVGAALR